MRRTWNDLQKQIGAAALSLALVLPGAALLSACRSGRSESAEPSRIKTTVTANSSATVRGDRIINPRASSSKKKAAPVRIVTPTPQPQPQPQNPAPVEPDNRNEETEAPAVEQPEQPVQPVQPDSDQEQPGAEDPGANQPPVVDPDTEQPGGGDGNGENGDTPEAPQPNETLPVLDVDAPEDAETVPETVPVDLEDKKFVPKDYGEHIHKYVLELEIGTAGSNLALLKATHDFLVEMPKKDEELSQDQIEEVVYPVYELFSQETDEISLAQYTEILQTLYLKALDFYEYESKKDTDPDLEFEAELKDAAIEFPKQMPERKTFDRIFKRISEVTGVRFPKDKEEFQEWKKEKEAASHETEEATPTKEEEVNS